MPGVRGITSAAAPTGTAAVLVPAPPLAPDLASAPSCSVQSREAGWKVLAGPRSYPDPSKGRSKDERQGAGAGPDAGEVDDDMR